MSSDGPRLYLVTPPLADTRALVDDLGAAMEAGDVACVLLRLAARDETDAKKIVRTIVDAAGRGDTAILVETFPGLAARAGADGVHVSGVGAPLREALDSLKPERIVGCGGLRSRDDAMQAGEDGVDYVMFGDPAADGWVPSCDDTVERVKWWAEIFNVPCVAYAADLDGVAPLVAAGADFVALGDWVWRDGRGASAVVAAAQAALGEGQRMAAATAGFEASARKSWQVAWRTRLAGWKPGVRVAALRLMHARAVAATR